ncbi:hypothetical protein JCM19000A_35650 [Silvimonas sp. JCM 19000]
MKPVLLILLLVAMPTASQSLPWGRLFSDEAQRQQAEAPLQQRWRLSACVHAPRLRRCWVDGTAVASAPIEVRVGESWSLQP